MKKKLKNAEMAAMLNQLRPVLVHRDKIGYFAARNFRVLSECLTEYDAFRNSLIEKYGEETKDDKGRPIIGVKVDSPISKSSATNWLRSTRWSTRSS